jgi:uncharacterized SAM-binding protein YcdF (DUF218 family)
MTFVAVLISRFGAEDHARRSDCIIVLGAAVQRDTPSPVFEERLRHAVYLYQNGFAQKIILTGGFGEGAEHSESAVGSSFIRRLGVPDTDILTEERSHTTRRNLAEATDLMKSHRLRSAIIVSDPDHMKRAMMMAKDLGIDAVSSPTHTSRFKTFKTRAPFLLREVYFFHHYLVTGN